MTWARVRKLVDLGKTVKKVLIFGTSEEESHIFFVMGRNGLSMYEIGLFLL